MMRAPLVAVASFFTLIAPLDRHPDALTRTAQAPATAPRSAPVRHVDRAELLRDVQMLASPAFEGRQTGTPGGIRARHWIAERFGDSGVAPIGAGGYVQPFTVTSHDLGALLPGGRPFRTTYAAGNIVGRVGGRGGRGRVIVVTAHYDHLGIQSGTLYPGADDNASGVAVLLAAARHFVANDPHHSMIFAALDAEEMGLRGAKALLASGQLPPALIALNVNLDMVSRSDTNEIFAAGVYHSPRLRPLLEDVQRRAAVTIRFGHDKPLGLADNLEDWTNLSDHGAFHRAGVPFIYFGVEDHPDHHTPTDTPQRIDRRFFGDAADMIVEALRTFDVDWE
jgi:hypothetical protein